MRTRTWMGLALLALTTVAGTAPALATHGPPPPGCRQIRGAETAEDHGDDASVCRQDVWMHRANTRVGNLAGPGLDTVPSWNTTKPTASLPESGAL